MFVQSSVSFNQHRELGTIKSFDRETYSHSSQQNLHFSGPVNFNTEGFLSLTKNGVDRIEQNQKESIYEPEEESATTLESYFTPKTVCMSVKQGRNRRISKLPEWRIILS